MSYPWGEQIFDHPDPIGLSYSSDGVYEHCKRKFEFYKFYQRMQREDSFDGEVGKAMHHGFQTWLRHGCTPEAREIAYYELCLAYPVLMDRGGDPADKKSLEACYGALEDIFNKGGLLLEYEIATVKCLDGIERPAIEVEFEIWIDGMFCDGRPFVYRGFIDAILFNRFTGEYRVIDLKTTGWSGDHLVGKYKFSSQCVIYGIVLQAILQQPLNFTATYVNAVINILEPETTYVSFPKTDTDVSDWATGLYMRLKQIIEFKERDFFPRTEHGCVTFKRPCEFLGICEVRDREVIDAYLAEKYVQEPKRNPWVRLILPLGEIANAAGN